MGDLVAEIFLSLKVSEDFFFFFLSFLIHTEDDQGIRDLTSGILNIFNLYRKQRPCAAPRAWVNSRVVSGRALDIKTFAKPNVRVRLPQ